MLPSPMGVTKAKKPHPLWEWRYTKTQKLMSQGW